MALKECGYPIYDSTEIDLRHASVCDSDIGSNRPVEY